MNALQKSVAGKQGGEIQAFSPAQLIEQVALVQSVMKNVMRDNEHYGKIPGCGDKPTLLKPGAEKLAFTFRLAPEYSGEENPIDLGNGHREYIIKTTLRHIETGKAWGQGVGSCSTMERKYRFRTGPSKSTGKPVPKAYWDLRGSDPSKAQEALGGKGFVARKENGQWMICQQGESVENDNPADNYNTVLKMAKKRSLVDATITATACSDIFTQDVEDLGGKYKEAAPQEETNTARSQEVHAPATTTPTRAPVQPNEEVVNNPDNAAYDDTNLQDNIKTGVIEEVTSVPYTDKKTGQEKTRYGIVIDDKTYGTFDSKLAGQCQGLKGQLVKFEFKQNGKFLNILAVSLADEQ